MASTRAPSVRLSRKCDPIEVTMGGFIEGTPADPYRRFIPGPTRYVVEYDDGTTVHYAEPHPEDWQRLVDMMSASDAQTTAYARELCGLEP